MNKYKITIKYETFVNAYDEEDATNLFLSELEQGQKQIIDFVEDHLKVKLSK